MAEKNKQVVQYRVTPYQYIQVGESAVVIPVDHPDTELVTNGQAALTSEVLSYDTETGEFETKNTLYKVVAEETQPSQESSSTAE
jgi:hypothetical protein